MNHLSWDPEKIQVGVEKWVVIAEAALGSPVKKVVKGARNIESQLWFRYGIKYSSPVSESNLMVLPVSAVS